MAVRTQIYLEERQVRMLRAHAQRQHTTVSDLVRKGVDLLIDGSLGAGADDDPLLGLIGSVNAGRNASRSIDKVVYGPKWRPRRLLRVRSPRQLA